MVKFILRELDTLGKLSAILNRGENFCDCLLAFLHTQHYLKMGLLWKVGIHLGANSYLLMLIPLQTESSLENWSFPLKKMTQESPEKKNNRGKPLEQVRTGILSWCGNIFTLSVNRDGHLKEVIFKPGRYCKYHTVFDLITIFCL